jgi:hypothetical protein
MSNLIDNFIPSKTMEQGMSSPGAGVCGSNRKLFELPGVKVKSSTESN